MLAISGFIKNGKFIGIGILIILILGLVYYNKILKDNIKNLNTVIYNLEHNLESIKQSKKVIMKSNDIKIDEYKKQLHLLREILIDKETENNKLMFKNGDLIDKIEELDKKVKEQPKVVYKPKIIKLNKCEVKVSEDTKTAYLNSFSN